MPSQTFPVWITVREAREEGTSAGTVDGKEPDHVFAKASGFAKASVYAIASFYAIATPDKSPDKTPDKSPGRPVFAKATPGRQESGDRCPGFAFIATPGKQESGNRR